jgi:hypothetical protein
MLGAFYTPFTRKLPKISIRSEIFKCSMLTNGLELEDGL